MINRSNQEHFFIATAPLEVNRVVLQHLSMRDALQFSMTCYLLWMKHQNLLFIKLMTDPELLRTVDGFYILTEMFQLDPFFLDHPPVYSRLHLPSLTEQTEPNSNETASEFNEPVVSLGHIFSSTGFLLPAMIDNDPYSVWKIAAVCGFELFVTEFMGDKLITARDAHGRGVLDYFSAGNQLVCIEHCFDLQLKDKGNPDPHKKATIMAAAGGNVKVLQDLKNRGYDLKRIFPEPTAPTDQQETLLTYAEMNGNPETITYLEKEGVDPKVGKGLAFYTASRGFWKRSEEHRKCYTPYTKETAGQYWHEMTRFAIRQGRLKQALSLMEQYSLSTDDFALCVVTAGNAEIFWHYVDKKLVSLDQRFGTGQTVFHVLALRGHLPLLISVLEKPQSTQTSIYTLDGTGQSVLHAAARGNRWDVYCYVLKHFDASKLPLVDANGTNVAHCAAEEGAVWFLKRLKSIDSPLLREVDNNSRTILHAATACLSTNALIMINEEFGISFDTTDNAKKTPLDYLVDKASENPLNWYVLNGILEYTKNWDFLERRHATHNTILDFIIFQKATQYFPTLFDKPISSLDI